MVITLIYKNKFLDLDAYSPQKHLLSDYYVAGIMLDIENVNMTKT